jgi:uroporphyrinogen-III synthase
MTPARTARQNGILDAAASLLGDRCAETVTMDEIAARAGVAKGTLYLYFASKDDLVRELFDSRLDALVRGIRVQPNARRAVAHAFRFQVEAPDWFRLRQRADSTNATRAILREKEPLLRTALLDVLFRGTNQADDRERATDFALGAIDAAVRRCLDPAHEGVDLDREATALWRFLRRALGAPSLAGHRVLVTRDEPNDGPLADAFRSREAIVRRVPVLETRPPADASQLLREVERIASYDWLVLTSARAADALARMWKPNGTRPRFAVVGEATARSARATGWMPDVVGHGGAAQLVEEMRAHGADLAGQTVLFPASDRVREEGVRALEDAGAVVHLVTAYRTEVRESAADELRDALGGDAGVVTFASPSAVDAFFALAGEDALGSHRAAAIGPTTRDRLAQHGVTNAIVSDEPDFESLADTVAEALCRKERDLA